MVIFLWYNFLMECHKSGTCSQNLKYKILCNSAEKISFKYGIIWNNCRERKKRSVFFSLFSIIWVRIMIIIIIVIIALWLLLVCLKTGHYSLLVNILSPILFDRKNLTNNHTLYQWEKEYSQRYKNHSSPHCFIHAYVYLVCVEKFL